MPYCTQCGKPNKDGIKFCTTCGKLLPVLQKKIVGIYTDIVKVSGEEVKVVNQQTENTFPANGEEILPPQKSKKWLWISLAAILLAGGGITAYFLFFASSRVYKTLYVLPDNLKLRSSQYDNSDANIITSVVYGSPISILKEEGDWVKVKFKEQEGYMRTRYLINDKDFFETDAIVHTIGLADTIKESRYKKSLLNYFRLNNYKPPFAQVTLFIKQTFLSDSSKYKNKEEWRIVPADTGISTYVRGKFNGTSKSGMGIIIEKSNDNNTKRKLLIFTYDDNENELPVKEFIGNYKWINYLNKTNDGIWFINNAYQGLPYNAILALEDKTYVNMVFLYNGSTIQQFVQPEISGD